jgi:hypothetical protein
VRDENGDPRALIQVVLSSVGMGFDRFTGTDDQGGYRFDHVREGSVVVQVCEFDGGEQLTRCASARATVVAGATQVLDLSLPALAEIDGTVFAPDGVTPVPDALVTLESFTGAGPIGFFSRAVSAGPDGHYAVAAVPVGGVRVTASDPADSSRFGRVSVDLPSAGATADVTLGSSVPLPLGLDGADGFAYDVGCQGDIVTGGTLDGRLARSYQSAYSLRIDGTPFPCAPAAAPEDNLRELALGPVSLAGLQVTRKAFVPPSGRFVRLLEILSNPGESDVTVTVEITGNLASGTATRIVVPPSETELTYSVTDDAGPCCRPVLSHVFGGRNASVSVSSAQFENGVLSYRWDLTVPAQSTIILMHFAAQREPEDSRGAVDQARALAELSDSDVFRGMTFEEVFQVVNFELGGEG